MTCSPSQTAEFLEVSSGRERIASRAREVLHRFGASIDAIPGVAGGDEVVRVAATATALMDLFRRTAEAEVFDCLIQLVAPQLLSRVRSRLRNFGAQFDPHEVLQDTIVNIYRYPDRFDASRPGAFAAWSSTIVDNAIRRQLRQKHSGPDVSLSPTEVLAQQADLHTREPDVEAQDHEECRATASAFAMLLACYLASFQRLSERERFVLQMVEVQRMRYAELASLLGIRAEALKMVVFRGRKRIFDRIAVLLSSYPAAA